MQPVLSNRFIIIIVVFDIRERNNSQHFLRKTTKMTSKIITLVCNSAINCDIRHMLQVALFGQLC